MFDSFISDTRYAVRSLLRTPTFTIAAVLCLAIGIGANATMFGVVDALLFRPPAHIVDPQHLVFVPVANYLDYVDQRDGARSFSAVAAYTDLDLSMARGSGTLAAVHALA